MTAPADLPAGLPDDRTLTDRGLAPAGGDAASRVLLLACGALAREILGLIEANGWSHIDLMCLPAILHNRPDRIPPAVEDAVRKHRAAYADIFVVYADCGTGGDLERTCDALGVEMIRGPHCYAFYQGIDDFIQHAEDECTAFYLTDFLVRQFDAFVWKPLGLARHPELLEMYFGNYEKLVYQAQTDDAALDARARDCAARLGLAYERRFTGYGDLAASLNAWAAR